MVADEGKFKESIWSINPNWRGWFYGVLLACGVAVSVFTIWTLCGRKPSESWIDIFDAVWNGIVGSVVVVWFVFQAVDWVTPRAISLFNYIKKIMAWGDPYREAQIKKSTKKSRKGESGMTNTLYVCLGLLKSKFGKRINTYPVGPPRSPFPR